MCTVIPIKPFLQDKKLTSMRERVVRYEIDLAHLTECTNLMMYDSHGNALCTHRFYFTSLLHECRKLIGQRIAIITRRAAISR